MRFSQRKDLQYYQPDISGPSGGGGNGFIHAISQQAAVGYTWALTSDVASRSAFCLRSRPRREDARRISAARACRSSTAFPGCPPRRNLTGGLELADRQRIQRNSGGRPRNPQFQNPTSFNPKVELHAGSRDGIRSRRAMNSSPIRTEVLDVNPLYGSDTYSGQFSKPTCASARAGRRLHRFRATPPVTISRISSSACPAPSGSETMWSPTSASTSTRSTRRTITASRRSSL